MKKCFSRKKKPQNAKLISNQNFDKNLILKKVIKNSTNVCLLFKLKLDMAKKFVNDLTLINASFKISRTNY